VCSEKVVINFFLAHSSQLDAFTASLIKDSYIAPNGEQLCGYGRALFTGLRKQCTAINSKVCTLYSPLQVRMVCLRVYDCDKIYCKFMITTVQ
jgi:hypothetical protein